MLYASLLLFGIVLFESFTLLHIGRDAMAIVTRSQEAMRILKSTEIDDDAKEVHMRRGSLEVFQATLRFALKFAVIGAILYLLFAGIVLLRPELEQPILSSLVSPLAIVALTVATLGYAWIRRKVFARG